MHTYRQRTVNYCDNKIKQTFTFVNPWLSWRI